jgi:hypothetical protein
MLNRAILPIYHASRRSSGGQTRGYTVEWRLRRQRGTARARDRVVSETKEGMSHTVRSDRAPGRVEHVARAIPVGICRKVVPRQLWSGSKKTHTAGWGRNTRQRDYGGILAALGTPPAFHARAAAIELQ